MNKSTEKYLLKFIESVVNSSDTVTVDICANLMNLRNSLDGQLADEVSELLVRGMDNLSKGKG